MTMWRVGSTLHHSSPLFTQVSATTHKGGIRQIQLPSLLFLLEFDEQIRLSLLDGEERWRVVKSCRTSSPRQTPCLSRFARDGWRVKSISWLHCLFKSRNQESMCWSLFSISYCRFYYAVWTANWQIWWQLAVLGKTVNCSGSASLLFYVNS